MIFHKRTENKEPLINFSAAAKTSVRQSKRQNQNLACLRKTLPNLLERDVMCTFSSGVNSLLFHWLRSHNGTGVELLTKSS